MPHVVHFLRLVMDLSDRNHFHFICNLTISALLKALKLMSKILFQL
jgi:hypothetical protein